MTFHHDSDDMSSEDAGSGNGPACCNRPVLPHSLLETRSVPMTQAAVHEIIVFSDSGEHVVVRAA